MPSLHSATREPLPNTPSEFYRAVERGGAKDWYKIMPFYLGTDALFETVLAVAVIASGDRKQMRI